MRPIYIGYTEIGAQTFCISNLTNPFKGQRMLIR